MMDLNEFRKKTLKVETKKKFKISGSCGNKKAYRWLKKNKFFGIVDSLSAKDFNLIIRTINKALVKEFLQGKDITFPKQMGRLEVRRRNKKITFEKGRLQANIPVDWKQTIKLWYEDEDARKKKTLVRMDIDVAYSIFYNRKTAKYENQSFFQFSPNRFLKRALSEVINNNDINPFLYEVRQY